MIDVDRPGGQRGAEGGHQLDSFRPLERLQRLVQRDPGGVGNHLLGKYPRGLVGEFVEALGDSERTRFGPGPESVELGQERGALLMTRQSQGCCCCLLNQLSVLLEVHVPNTSSIQRSLSTPMSKFLCDE